jgi:hypothetical protein
MAEMRINNIQKRGPRMMKYALSERMAHNHALIRGLSCDEDGVFLAGDVSLICRGSTGSSDPSYAARPSSELEILLAAAYGDEWDFSVQIAGLQVVARYMNEEKWALAKIASVHLRLPEISDDLALAKLLATEARYFAEAARAVIKNPGPGVEQSPNTTFRGSHVFRRAKTAAANGRAMVVTSDS